MHKNLFPLNFSRQNAKKQSPKGTKKGQTLQAAPFYTFSNQLYFTITKRVDRVDSGVSICTKYMP
jgi:hypothetical protein